MDILFVLLYAGLSGFYNVFKKLAVVKSRETTVLVLFTTVAFLLSLIWIPFGISISWQFILIFALKGFLLALSWFLTLKVLQTADLSLVTIINVLSAVLSFVSGMLIFKESASVWQIVGSVLVVLGVAAINLVSKKQKGSVTVLQFFMLLFGALVTTSTTIIDKFTTSYLTNHQVQFWFLLFVCVFSWIFFLIDCLRKKEFLIKKDDLKNWWTYLVGVFLFVGDYMLFRAYKVPGSKMITISILAQLKVVIAVLAGILIFKEKNIWKKLALLAVVILGAVLISVF